MIAHSLSGRTGGRSKKFFTDEVYSSFYVQCTYYGQKLRRGYEGAPLAFKTWCRNQRGGGEPLVPQYLADQLTIFQPEKGRLSPPITTGTPNVFNFSATLHKVSIQWALGGIRVMPPWLDKVQGGSQNLMRNSLHFLIPSYILMFYVVCMQRSLVPSVPPTLLK